MKSIFSKAIGLLTCSCLLSAISAVASGATVGYWDFEQGVPGSAMTAGTTTPAVPGLANGYGLYADATNLPSFSAAGNGPLGYGICAQFTPNQCLYTNSPALDNFSTDTWTVEFSFNLSSVGGWLTMIGRDYLSSSASAMYIQKADETSRLRLTYRTVGEELVSCDSNLTPVANTWYRVAIVQNVNIITFYVDKLDGNGYVLDSTFDMDALGTSGADHSCLAGKWSFGRGMYNSGNGDWITGMLGEVRISDTALTEAELLNNSSEFAFPSPSYRETNVDVNADLSWSTANPSATAYSYNVYFTDDPNTIDPNNTTATPVSVQTKSYDLPVLGYSKGYGWRVDVVKTAGATPVTGPVMLFTTADAVVSITGQPVGVVAAPDATFTVTTISATDFAWFKDGDAVALADGVLPSGAVVSGATTRNLTISGATLAEEGQYYCVASNATFSAESDKAYLWTPRLMGYWKFEGNLTDSVATEVTGVPTHDGELGENTLTTGDGIMVYASSDEAAGFAGDAAKFTGDSDFVAIDGDFFNFYREGMTVNFWMKTNVVSGWHLPISKLDAGTAGWLLGSDTAGGYIESAIIETASGRAYGPEVDTADLNWHMFTLTYDAASDLLSLYVDGDQGATLSINLANYALPTSPLSVGGRAGENSVDAYIDELEIYSYALTPTEVAVKYTDLVPGSFVCVEDPDNALLYDNNGDCRVNIADFAMFALEWLDCQRYPASSCQW
ncbi:MAG: hypothetical protein JXM68_09495 [Sedimentisphaerales bacterium]|nr:hypothetical protein [Sedimentisphaerales bacterium]